MANNKINMRDQEYRDAIIISPSNSVNIAADATNNPLGYPIANALMVTVTGNAVVVIYKESDPSTEVSITFTGLPVGTIIPFPVKRVNSTGTTASFVGLIK